MTEARQAGTVDTVQARRTYLHYDLDAFFASVEAALDPRLAELATVIVGHGKRAVICCANYPARQLGLRAAQPAYAARRPGVTSLTIRPEAYRRVGDLVAGLFGGLGEIRRESIDEATVILDAPFDSVRVENLRAQLRTDYGLSASIGVATSRTLAKMASEHAKPGGMLALDESEAAVFLAGATVRSIPGCGPKTAERLEAAGITTGATVASCSEDTLTRLVGAAMARRLKTVISGGDPPEVKTRRQVSAGTTFDDPLPPERAHHAYEELFAKAWARAGTVDEVTLTEKRPGGTRRRSKQLDHPTTSRALVHDTLRRLVVDDGPLLGLTVTLGVTDAPAQATLFDEEPEETDDVNPVAHRLADVIHRGMLIEHLDFGPGLIQAAANGAVRVRFNDRERLLEITALENRWRDPGRGVQSSAAVAKASANEEKPPSA